MSEGREALPWTLMATNPFRWGQGRAEPKRQKGEAWLRQGEGEEGREFGSEKTGDAVWSGLGGNGSKILGRERERERRTERGALLTSSHWSWHCWQAEQRRLGERLVARRPGQR